MLKALTCPVIVTGCATRSDGSLTVRLTTPELSADEKAAFMELQNRNLKLLLQPADEEPAELKEVKREFDHKTPGARLRSVLFILWKTAAKEQGEFEDFYRRRMEALINSVKDQLPDQT